MMLGTAMYNARQTGLEKQQAVQEKLATLAVFREGVNAFLTAAIAEAEESPGGLLMPNQSLLYAGRVHACSGLAEMMHVARDLCGGQICVTPDFASFTNPETEPWLRKFYTINEDWQAEDRRRLLAYARDLLNSDYAGHRLTFQLFAQSPPFAHLLAVYHNFDFAEPMRIVRESAGLSEQVDGRRLLEDRLEKTASRRRQESTRQLRRLPSAPVSPNGPSPSLLEQRIPLLPPSEAPPLVTTHRRIRPFNTRETYPEQNLDNDLCQAVVAGNTIYLRGQIGQDLDTRESVGIGDVAAQTERAMANIAMLLEESGSALEDIVKIVVYLTDVRYRDPVYQVMGRWLKGVFPVSTGVVVTALARPEWVVEIDAIAVIPESRPTMDGS